MPADDPLPRNQITGLILAGGMGRRMGNADKGLQHFDGRPLVEWVMERLQPQVGALMINANRNLDRYRGYGHPLVPDRLTDFPGPLAGLHAGLAACAMPLLVTAPCDSPYLPTDLVARLHSALLQSNAMAAAARCDGKLQPVFLLVRRDMLASLDRYLASGERKMQNWLTAIGAVAVDFPDPHAFDNINTPEQLKR
jgi:molybdopterin-guanine dinucleotide biosynthesis protein A